MKGYRATRLALLVLPVLLSVATTGCGTSSAPKASGSATHLKRYRGLLGEPILDKNGKKIAAGWVLSYPQTLHLEHSYRTLGFDGFVDEVTVANFPMSSPIRSTKTSLWVLPPRDSHGTFPSNGIALRVSTNPPDPTVPWLPPAESHFPLRLSNFHRVSASTPVLWQTIVADTWGYMISARIGPKASASERATLARVVRSIAFPRLHAGQCLGGIGVFARASHYPVGSFTRIRVGGSPTYLVHAPGGCYAAGTWATQSYGRRCRFRLDRASKEFFCTNIRARWDRIGNVIIKPRSARRGDPLWPNTVGLSWDRHVLVASGLGGGISAHQLWPSIYP